LYDSRVVNKFMLEAVESAIKNRMPQIEVQYIRTNMLAVSDIQVELERVVNTYQGKELQIDFTGGCELMIACGLLVANARKITPTYADFYSGYMFHVQTLERLEKIEHVKLGDYLTAIGGKYISASPYTPQEKDYARLLSMAQIIFSHEKKWDKFFAHMTKGYSAHGNMEFSMKEKQNDEDCCFILNAFLEKNFAKQIGTDRYRFASEQDKHYMTVSGIWLELYLYIQAKKCYDDVYLGVDIDWNKRDICQSRDNEIDVVIMKNSHPIFISCKMRPIEKETVYEIYSMAKRLGGNKAKSLIATTVDVRSSKDERNGIYLRMEKMKVGLIESKDFIRHNPSEVFSKALHMTE